MMPLAYTKSCEGILSSLKSTEKGLTSPDARRRLDDHGFNELAEKEKISALQILIQQFNSIVIWILIGATLISFFLDEIIEAIVILIVLFLIAILGFYQEYKAERAIEALKRLACLEAKVLRDGEQRKIEAKYLVPGDIILLESGDKIPGDARVIEGKNLQTQEAALTGESQPVKKITEKIQENAPLAERKNMVYSGTVVSAGKAKAVITETGMQTEIGKIAGMIQEQKPEPTPLQRKMDMLGRKLGILTLIITFIVFVVGTLRNPAALSALLDGNILLFFSEVREIFNNAVALAVAAIPEGLPAVVTISLALGTRRMLKRHALVRKLPSVETLGSTTIICTDKTGTLTMNEMTVKKIYTNGKIMDITGSGYNTGGDFFHRGKEIDPSDVQFFLTIGAVNNDAEIHGDEVVGDPTEAALLVSAEKSGLQKEELNELYPRIDEIEFTSERKRMTTIHTHNRKKILFTKGAPEIILDLCTSIREQDTVRKLTKKDREHILQVNKEFGGQALRVLGFAYSENSQTESDLIFVGMQAMIDPPRKEVKDAIAKCHDAGIKVVMITGDQENTAVAVAGSLGLRGRAVHGSQIDSMGDFDDQVESITIFSRVNPQHKLKIVDALKKKGHTVAMTGDGVNDAPALKKADIGIAMGKTGTDVSKEAADMILTDDNFTSIVNAVEEGRGTYDNIRKYFGFLISGNIGEVLIVFLAILVGLPAPLTAIQILLINLVTDTLPALALSTDPFEPKAMTRKPRKKDEPVYSGLKPYIIYYPMIMVVVTLALFTFIYFTTHNLLHAQTAAFVSIAFFELYQAFACRSTIYPSYQVGLFKNGYLVLAVLSSIAIILSLIYIPGLNTSVGMFPLSVLEFLIIVILSSSGAITIELLKSKKR